MSHAARGEKTGVKKPRHFHVIIGIGLIILGVVIASLSLPVSRASHEIRDEVKKRELAKAGLGAGLLGAMALVWLPGFFAGEIDPNGNEIVNFFKMTATCITVAWWFCVCLMSFLVNLVIEPIGEALGVAAQFGFGGHLL